MVMLLCCSFGCDGSQYSGLTLRAPGSNTTEIIYQHHSLFAAARGCHSPRRERSQLVRSIAWRVPMLSAPLGDQISYR